MSFGGIFLTVKDLMKITGSNSYNASSQLHRTIRDVLGKSGGKLTIKEYCIYENIDFDYVWSFLREENEGRKIKSEK